MNTLLAGYERFRTGYWREHEALYSTLARDGQSPSAMVIACADSRVAPEMIFDCAPGDIFVVRNVSALVPPYAPDDKTHGTSAALEFAVMSLRVRNIVVMGHSRCGGIRALVTGPGGAHGDFIEILDGDRQIRPRPRVRRAGCARHIRGKMRRLRARGGPRVAGQSAQLPLDRAARARGQPDARGDAFRCGNRNADRGGVKKAVAFLKKATQKTFANGARIGSWGGWSAGEAHRSAMSAAMGCRHPTACH